jgi:hypothetical protein
MMNLSHRFAAVMMMNLSGDWVATFSSGDVSEELGPRVNHVHWYQ